MKPFTGPPLIPPVLTKKLSPFTFPPVPILDRLCSALLLPDDVLKASVLTVWIRLHEAAEGAVAEALPGVIRDRVCVLLLLTLSNASSPPLILSCLGKEKPLSLSELLFCCYK